MCFHPVQFYISPNAVITVTFTFLQLSWSWKCWVFDLFMFGVTWIKDLRHAPPTAKLFWLWSFFWLVVFVTFFKLMNGWIVALLGAHWLIVCKFWKDCAASLWIIVCFLVPVFSFEVCHRNEIGLSGSCTCSIQGGAEKSRGQRRRRSLSVLWGIKPWSQGDLVEGLNSSHTGREIHHGAKSNHSLSDHTQADHGGWWGIYLWYWRPEKHCYPDCKR